MKLLKTSQGTVLNVHVKPYSKEFRIKIEDDELVVFCREPPEKGKVNKELIKELSRLFKKRAEVLSGFTSKQKRILIKGATVEEVNETLSKHGLENV
jgi:uncharacterized protein (TIGR00251 family)